MRKNNATKTTLFLAPALAALLLLGGCNPTVKVETPDKPIEINMNIKIQQEVRVKVDKDLDAAIMDDPSLFGVSPDQVPADGQKTGEKK
ncbi:MAG: YnbE family lipoprotein [Alphaproteobacteria bacterium]|nr:YnbE family lipoprotein [Alphaproteobacteria bacterium]